MAGGSTAIYGLTQATVVAQGADTGTLTVLLRDGQGLAVPVQMLYSGPCDGLRISQSPMPGRGTVGIVAFVNNDLRSGVWLGSVVPGLVDAIPNASDDPFVGYAAHISGYWDSLDGSGNTTTVWPDGTQAIVGSAFQPFRHIQSSAGPRARVPVASGDRPPPPAPFPIALDHASGTKMSISSAGSVSVSAAAGQTITITANAASIEIDASGNVSIISPGLAHVQAPAVHIDDAGTIQTLLTQAFGTWTLGHVHTDPQGGSTGPPTTSPPASAYTSILQAQ